MINDEYILRSLVICCSIKHVLSFRVSGNRLLEQEGRIFEVAADAIPYDYFYRMRRTGSEHVSGVKASEIDKCSLILTNPCQFWRFLCKFMVKFIAGSQDKLMISLYSQQICRYIDVFVN